MINMKFYKLAFLLCLCFLNFQKIIAQTNIKRNPLPALEYLLINPDPVGGSLGFSGVTSTNSYSSFYNVGASSFSKATNEVNFTYTKVGASLVNDMNLINVNYMFNPFKSESDKVKLSRFMVGLTYFSHGTVELRSTTGVMTGTIEPFDLNFKVSYSKRLSDKLSLGVGLKYLNSRYFVGDVQDFSKPITTTGLSALNGDMGLYYQTDMDNDKKWNKKFGVSIHNIGGKVNFSDSKDLNFQPTIFRIGTSFERKIGTIDEESDSKFLVNLEFTKLLVPTPSDKTKTAQTTGIGAIFSSWGDAPNGLSEELSEIWTSVGLSYIHEKTLAFRTGLFYDPASKGDRTILTLGLGIQEIELPNNALINLDMSYRTSLGGFNPMTNTFQVGLTYRFKNLIDQND